VKYTPSLKVLSDSKMWPSACALTETGSKRSEFKNDMNIKYTGT